MKTYSIDIYRLDVTAQTFSHLAEITSYMPNISWVERKNGIGGMIFKLDIHDPLANDTNLLRYANAVLPKENNEGNISYLWSGVITKVSGNINGIEGAITVECNTILWALSDRYTDYERIFNNTSQSTIMWTLIDETQSRDNGFLGIYQGTLSSTTPRDRKYQRGRVSDLLVNMSNAIGGCDFSFDVLTDSDGLFTGWAFNTYNLYKGTLRTDLNPITIEKVSSLDFSTKGDIYNYIVGVGGGTGEAVITSVQELEDSQLGSTRRETFYTNKDVTVQETLDEQTEGELNKKSVDNFEVSVSMLPDVNPSYTEYTWGDYLKLELEKGYLNLNYWALVTEITYSIDEAGVLRASPTLSII